MTHLNNGAKKGERGVFAISAQQAVGQCKKSANQNSAKYKNTEQKEEKVCKIQSNNQAKVL